MHQEQANEDNEPGTQNSSNESNQHDNGGPSEDNPSGIHDDTNSVAGPGSTSTSGVQNVQQSAAILKLDIDCCEEAFDYLPLEDLINIGNTCNRLKSVIGFILHQYYPGVYIECREDVIVLHRWNINHLVEYIPKIMFMCDRKFEWFRFIQSKCYRLRRLDFCYKNLTDSQIDCVKLVLEKIETLRFLQSNVDGGFHEKFLKFCPKIKTLSISQDDQEAPILIGNGNEWMNRHYPTLECFVCENIVITEVQTFLELNQNIRKVSTSDRYIRRQGASLMTANIKLDDLEISIESIDEEIVLQLNALYERGFYQRLKVRIVDQYYYGNAEIFAQLNGLVAFHVKYTRTNFGLAQFTGLKEICIGKSRLVVDLPTLPINLPRLERIVFCEAPIDDILPFIRQSVYLQMIKVVRIMCGIYLNSDNVINLMKLNEERARLEGAEKTTIYMKEEIYLATKWALKETDYTYVQLKRLEAYKRSSFY